MPDLQEQITAYINDHKEQMLTMLEEMVCIQSGSKNKPGVDNVADYIQAHMSSLGFACERCVEKESGDNLVVRSFQFDPEKKQILLIGHMDTVFPRETKFNFFKQDNEKCFGPGVADMKGGLVVAIFALKALQKTGILNQIPVSFIFNSDEEVGSPSSRPLIRKEAKKSKAAFVFEAGGLNGEVVTGRKGNFSARVKIEGQAGHAAFAGKDKASAILELAHKTIQIEQLNAPDRGVSANVGTITGGIGPNTVAQHASAKLDFRFPTSQDFADLKARAASIIEQTVLPGTQSSIQIVSQRPPMPQTKANQDLYLQMKNTADRLDIHIIDELRQGVSDANIVADEGIPVLDGLGPIGAKDHSEDEYIITQSLFDRAILFASFLAGLQ